MADRFGKFVGRLAFRASKKYRVRTLKNLSMCFPDWPASKVRTTAIKVFEHFGKTGARFFRSAKMSDEELLASTAMTGTEAISLALEAGKGALLVTGHYGNWERFAHVAGAMGFELGVVARDSNDKATASLVNNTRILRGAEVLSRGNAAREVLRRLRSNGIVAILPDQNYREILVPFFGIPAGTTRGPAIFHLKTKAPIVMGFCSEMPDGKYRAHLYALETPPSTGDDDKDVEAIMALINTELEKEIREHPEQWLWMHDRWRWTRELGLLKDE